MNSEPVIKRPIQTTMRHWRAMAVKVGKNIPDGIFFKLGVLGINQQNINIVYTLDSVQRELEYPVEMLINTPSAMEKSITNLVKDHISACKYK